MEGRERRRGALHGLAIALVFAGGLSFGACGSFGSSEADQTDGGADSSAVDSAAVVTDSGPDATVGCVGCTLVATGLTSAVDLTCGPDAFIVGTREGTVLAVSPGASSVRTVFRAGGPIGGVAVAGTRVLFTLPEAGTVGWVEPDGGASGTLFGGVSSPQGIDVIGATLYVADAKGVLRADTTPSIPTRVIEAGAAVAINADGEEIAASFPAESAIVVHHLDSGRRAGSIGEANGVGGISFTAANEERVLFWSNDLGIIWGIYGGVFTPRRLADGQTGITGVCLRDGILYWVRLDGSLFMMPLPQ